MYYELFGSDGDSDEAEAKPKLAPSPTASDGIVDEILKQAEAGDAEHQDSADDEEAASEAGDQIIGSLSPGAARDLPGAAAPHSGGARRASLD